MIAEMRLLAEFTEGCLHTAGTNQAIGSCLATATRDLKSWHLV